MTAPTIKVCAKNEKECVPNQNREMPSIHRESMLRSEEWFWKSTEEFAKVVDKEFLSECLIASDGIWENKPKFAFDCDLKAKADMSKVEEHVAFRTWIKELEFHAAFDWWALTYFDVAGIIKVVYSLLHIEANERRVADLCTEYESLFQLYDHSRRVLANAYFVSNVCTHTGPSLMAIQVYYKLRLASVANGPFVRLTNLFHVWARAWCFDKLHLIDEYDHDPSTSLKDVETTDIYFNSMQEEMHSLFFQAVRLFVSDQKGEVANREDYDALMKRVLEIVTLFNNDGKRYSELRRDLFIFMVFLQQVFSLAVYLTHNIFFSDVGACEELYGMMQCASSVISRYRRQKIPGCDRFRCMEANLVMFTLNNAYRADRLMAMDPDLRSSVQRSILLVIALAMDVNGHWIPSFNDADCALSTFMSLFLKDGKRMHVDDLDDALGCVVDEYARICTENFAEDQIPERLHALIMFVCKAGGCVPTFKEHVPLFMFHMFNVMKRYSVEEAATANDMKAMHVLLSFRSSLNRCAFRSNHECVETMRTVVFEFIRTVVKEELCVSASTHGMWKMLTCCEYRQEEESVDKVVQFVEGDSATEPKPSSRRRKKCSNSERKKRVDAAIEAKKKAKEEEHMRAQEQCDTEAIRSCMNVARKCMHAGKSLEALQRLRSAMSIHHRYCSDDVKAEYRQLCAEAISQSRPKSSSSSSSSSSPSLHVRDSGQNSNSNQGSTSNDPPSTPLLSTEESARLAEEEVMDVDEDEFLDAVLSVDEAPDDASSEDDELVLEGNEVSNDDVLSDARIHGLTVLDLLECPIGLCEFTDPVIAADGITYERSAIEAWLQKSRSSPMNGNLLPNTVLIPNLLVRNIKDLVCKRT